MDAVAGSRDEARRGPVRVAISILGWVAIIAVAAAVFIGVRTYGLTVNIVQTGSMEPNIHTGDYVVAVGPNVKPPKIGDVIIFDPRIAGKPLGVKFSHRLVDVNSQGWYVTKGDANNYPDSAQVGARDVTGTVVAVLPLAFLRSPLTVPIALAILLVVVFLVLYSWLSGNIGEDEGPLPPRPGPIRADYVDAATGNPLEPQPVGLFNPDAAGASELSASPPQRM